MLINKNTEDKAESTLLVSFTEPLAQFKCHIVLISSLVSLKKPETFEDLIELTLENV